MVITLFLEAQTAVEYRVVRKAELKSSGERKLASTPDAWKDPLK